MPMKFTYFLTTISALLVAPQYIYARDLNDATGILDGIGQRGGVSDVSVESAVGSGISIVLSLVGLIFLVLMVYAGILWLTARGEESQIDKAKKIIASTVVGLILTISAYAITALVTGRLGT